MAGKDIEVGIDLMAEKVFVAGKDIMTGKDIQVGIDIMAGKIIKVRNDFVVRKAIEVGNWYGAKKDIKASMLQCCHQKNFTVFSSFD